LVVANNSDVRPANHAPEWQLWLCCGDLTQRFAGGENLFQHLAGDFGHSRTPPQCRHAVPGSWREREGFAAMIRLPPPQRSGVHWTIFWEVVVVITLWWRHHCHFFPTMASQRTYKQILLRC
jgi:hypothetical protein